MPRCRGVVASEGPACLLLDGGAATGLWEGSSGLGSTSVGSGARRSTVEATFVDGGRVVPGVLPPLGLRGGGARRVLDKKSRARGRGTVKLRRPKLDAVSGAAAGCLVSIFLHPVDTIKVLVQTEVALGMRSRNLFQICKQLLAKSGGPRRLYYGLAANLASTVPISAIYTSSYEAAKHALTRVLGDDRARPGRREGGGGKPVPWLGHCLAGAAASVCTSFVYTPSECVKNRVQAGLYTNSWSALYHIVAKEGPIQLYRAWPAVVLRNVPQSIVKFFAYEQLKLLVVRCRGRDPTTGEMLAIGGFAGASGALFSTPFDVVKTRMQTQVGKRAQMSLRKTMGSLVAREGVLGLYRGVVPRLFIYLSQGAIFFTTYEILRSGLYKLEEVDALRRSPDEIDAKS
ncbi:mitochondrial carrier protein [Chloropicon primus]|uniref:Mitochondrial carrier protein n=2 Tax=Chloropicon primus TaxID=1764295 RepID=A0A5B8MCX0_9CHLO|nr:mitochondrial carrier protein [Chloropicon primus]UPQ97586.1 mitochondrial carrier protein [Chloropicon primus]|eukprot:QDZ18376.1 mitochondrial carrier protein [Chloropicon primus]